MSLFVIFKISVLFSMGLVLVTENWLLIWILVEFISFSLVVLLSMSSTPRSLEASTKYFIFQSMAGALLLLGLLMKVHMVGSMSLFSCYWSFSYYMILVSLGMKLAVFPNPFWFVDMVVGLNISRAFYVVIISKVVPLYLLLMMSSGGASEAFFLVGVVSAAYGAVFGINQTNIRKILALSSMSHLGWMVMMFPVLSLWGGSFLFLLYLMMMSPLFCVALVYPLDHLKKVKVVYHNYWAMLVLLMSLLSLGGLPPLVGFFYKWMIFQVLVGEGGSFVMGLLMMLSIITLFFYLKICFKLFSISWPIFKIYSSSFVVENLGTKGILSWESFLPMTWVVFSLMKIMGLFLVGPLSSFLVL